MNQDASGLAIGSCVPHLRLVLPFAMTNTRRDGHRLGPCRSVRRPEDVCVDTGHEIVVRYIQQHGPCCVCCYGTAGIRGSLLELRDGQKLKCVVEYVRTLQIDDNAID